MSLQLLFILVTAMRLMTSFITAQQQSALYEKCYETGGNSSRCYFLFGDRLANVTWDTASAQCSASNGSLAIIGDKATERRVTAFLQEVAGLSNTDVWIGGKRSSDNAWKYLHSLNKEMLNGVFPSNRYCAQRPELTVGPVSVSCTEKHLPLCQYNANSTRMTTEACPGGFLHTVGICLSTGLYPVTWFEARNYCRQNHPGGDLATVHDDLSDMEKSTGASTQLGYWIGLERRPWMWVTENGQTPIVQYLFDHGEGSDRRQSCLFIKLSANKDVYWADLPCDNSLNYYLCEIDNLLNVGVKDDDDDDSIPSTESRNKLSVVYIAVITTLTSAIVMLVIVVSIFIIRRHRARRQQDEPTSRQTDTKPSESGQVNRSIHPPISPPLQMKAPFPVSGYDNLGVLIPVQPNKYNQDMMPGLQNTVDSDDNCYDKDDGTLGE